MNMSYGKDGMDLTEGFEQCRLMPYRDSKGVPTDGWGNTHRVVMGVAITQEKADSDLLANVQDCVDCVNDNVTVPLSQDEFDALVDFCFNCGCGAFKGSTLLRVLNTGDYQGAEEQIAVWNKCAGVVLQGLINRRTAEQALFTKGMT